MYSYTLLLVVFQVFLAGAVVERCPSGWTYFKPTEKCFLVVRNKTWSDFDNLCKTFGGNLATIHIAIENTFLITFASPGALTLNQKLDFPKQVYIGLSTPPSTRNFQWVDGSPLDFVPWQPGQPDNMGNSQSCATLVTSDGKNPFYQEWTSGKWDDVNCGMLYDGICQMAAIQDDIPSPPCPTPPPIGTTTTARAGITTTTPRPTTTTRRTTTAPARSDIRLFPCDEVCVRTQPEKNECCRAHGYTNGGYCINGNAYCNATLTNDICANAGYPPGSAIGPCFGDGTCPGTTSCDRMANICYCT